MGVFNESPPIDTDVELKEYLSRGFNVLGIEINNKDKLIRYDVIPHKLQIGKLYFFNQAILNDPIITTEGFYGYTSNGWVKLG